MDYEVTRFLAAISSVAMILNVVALGVGVDGASSEHMWIWVESLSTLSARNCLVCVITSASWSGTRTKYVLPLVLVSMRNVLHDHKGAALEPPLAIRESPVKELLTSSSFIGAACRSAKQL